ncbi:hypothetical protein FHU41_002381 [Psychromicrobium silvestre]|uniref:Uncharacterized protein n=1 Tax=Psychromicrobium silvestre TaxID=1645614 RepID=A0A7Y9LV44_9MICC|nr:hypothetical protein [Psychromicrobium silvestre]NYE96131.1 hypothetical protein [Psychromicrobium silvestre]
MTTAPQGKHNSEAKDAHAYTRLKERIDRVERLLYLYIPASLCVTVLLMGMFLPYLGPKDHSVPDVSLATAPTTLGQEVDGDPLGIALMACFVLLLLTCTAAIISLIPLIRQTKSQLAIKFTRIIALLLGSSVLGVWLVTAVLTSRGGSAVGAGVWWYSLGAAIFITLAATAPKIKNPTPGLY